MFSKNFIFLFGSLGIVESLGGEWRYYRSRNLCFPMTI